ncbi:MAG: glycosyltransferase family 1 protein [Candidatus Omnitrophota bacterium]|jgi:hypothetical protein|nr:MAG: glycosyltransferase family 1 protein [Candidatus Omnitrophota bacterium]
MTWQSLTDRHRKILESNLRHVKRLRPDFDKQLPSILDLAESLQIEFDGNEIHGVRIVNEQQARIILPPESGQPLIQAQNRGLRERLQKGARFVALSGLGAGHVIMQSITLLKEYPRTAVAVFEPDSFAWAIFLSLFDANDVLAHDRLFLFAGIQARQQLADRIRQEYIFLLPSREVKYFLGALPVDPEITRFYIEEAKLLAQSINDRAYQFESVVTSFTQQLANPLSQPPRSIWSCTLRDSYIHFPIAKAFLAGFAKLGWKTQLEPFDSSFTTNFRIIGRLMESQPDFFLFINTLPAALLEDIGLTREAVEAINRPRVTLLVDNTSLYEDMDKPFSLSAQDWVFTIDRSYLSWLRRRTQRTAFLPVATMFEKSGSYREEYSAELSYVGSLPHVGPYLYTLPPACLQILETVEELRSRDSAHSFYEHLQTLKITDKHNRTIHHAAHSFCRTTQKGLRHPQSILEYFLYNVATYLKRKKIVLALLPLGLKVYGPDTWLEALPAPYRDRYGGFVASEQLADCYASTKISLNIHSHQCPTCLNPRDFDVPMAGGVVMGDWVEDAERGLLEPGKELLTFQTIEEAIEIMERYGNDADALDRIRRQGHERVNNEHRYVHRANQLLEIINLT